MARAVIVSAALCLLSLASLSWSASDIQCPAQTVQVSPDAGTVCGVIFGPLPASDPVGDPDEYDPAGLDGWYNLARGFVNVVQPENLPYGALLVGGKQKLLTNVMIHVNSTNSKFFNAHIIIHYFEMSSVCSEGMGKYPLSHHL